MLEDTAPPQTVVIASAPLVSKLRTLPDLQENTRIFSEADFFAALEVILTDAPQVIALDAQFAATARGAALVARIRTDPRFSGSEVRTLRAATGPDTTMDIAVPTDLPFGTRRAVRYEIAHIVETRVNGTLGQLINLSATGAQVILPIRLRPTETVRLLLTDRATELRLNGVVAWAAFEIDVKDAGPRYRVGVELHDVDEQAMDRYCRRNRQP
jgi:hypothetical protein